MQNKTLPLIIFFSVLIAGGYFLFSKPQEVKAPPMEEIKSPVIVPEETPVTAANVPKKYEITYTADGFAPAVLSVAVGDIVTFTNKSGEKFWPASNDHPTHTAYPEFDAKTEIIAGKTYEFTFTKPGEWGYHNHLDSKMMGVIVIKSL